MDDGGLTFIQTDQPKEVLRLTPDPNGVDIPGRHYTVKVECPCCGWKRTFSARPENEVLGVEP